MVRHQLTLRQAEILEFINRFTERQGYPPTRNEISGHFGFRSPNAAESHLRALAAKGVIRLQAGRSRGISLAAEPGNGKPGRYPLIGSVAAGTPILALENVEHRYPLDAALFPKRPDYLLRVRGDSMSGAGILDGDLLVVHQTQDVRHKAVVVARIDDEVTVKRLVVDKNQMILQPENPAYEPIAFDAAGPGFYIEGVGIGVIRQGL